MSNLNFQMSITEIIQVDKKLEQTELLAQLEEKLKTTYTIISID